MKTQLTPSNNTSTRTTVLHTPNRNFVIRGVLFASLMTLLFSSPKTASAQDTHLSSSKVMSQLWTMPHNIRRQGFLHLGRFRGHNAMDTNAHYQGITRHKNAVYLTSSFPDQGGRLLVMKANRTELHFPYPLSRFIPPVALSIQPVADSEIWDEEFWHFGGMDTCGDILAVAVENDEEGAVQLYDISQPLRPTLLHTYRPGLAKAGAVGLTRTPDGRWLMTVVGGSSNRVRIYESNASGENEFDFVPRTSFAHDNGSRFQSLSLVTTADNGVLMFGTYNDDYLPEGIPVGKNRIGVTLLMGLENQGKRLIPLNFGGRDLDLWRGYDSIAEESSKFSIGALVAGVLAGPFAGPAVLTAFAAGTVMSGTQLLSDFEHPNFDAGGGVLINERGRLEVWASSHGHRATAIPRFSTSW